MIPWVKSELIRWADLSQKAGLSTFAVPDAHTARSLPSLSLEARFAPGLIPSLCRRPVGCCGWRVRQRVFLARCGERIKIRFQSLLSIFQSLRGS